MPGPKMQAKAKLIEAQHFLDRLDESSKDPDMYKYNLSAFLSAWRSILDVMLFDFARKYWPGLWRDDRVSYESFLMAARASRHAEALQFVRWWKKRLDKIRLSPLYQKRNMIVHRRYPRMRFVLPVPSSMIGEELLGRSAISAVAVPFTAENRRGFGVVLREQYERLTDEERKELVDSWRARSRTELPAAIVRLKYCFEDYPHESAYEICLDAMRFMNRTLRTAEKRYWERSTGHP